MDYGKLRAAALGHGEDEEAVTVDTRALIDKVLARYSGEWTTLRELIQNAADAQATTVRVKWETLPSTHVPLPTTVARPELLKHVIQHHTLQRLVVSNDGQPFTQTDWGRLKRIAEGNPDETKIGAFGVGFYSVFADSEEPFISSGNEAMAFYWKGNALFTRKLQLSGEQCTSDTTFVLDYRNTTTPMPNLLSVSQFLATSLTFVSLERIEFWIDDYKILSLHKKISPSIDVALSKNVERSTKDRLMTVHQVERASAQIDASYMTAVGWKPDLVAAKASDSYGSDMSSLRSFFSKLTTGSTSSLRGKMSKDEMAAQDAISEDITQLSTSNVFLKITSAALKTTISPAFGAELERATKKPPPKMTKLSILTSSYDETQASEKSLSADVMSKATDVFASVLPSKKPGGRIFIGFPTAQTTGAGLHISAPSVIPTVEREAIDLNARWVRSWNIEMLRAAGIMIRLAFSHEMGELQQKLRRSLAPSETSVTSEVAVKHMPEAMHVLSSFTFGESTPSGRVSQIIEEAFWTCYKKPSIEVYSTRGVRLTNQVRIGSEELSKFVGGIPAIPPELVGMPFVRKLTEFALLSDISPEDVRQELSKQPLNKDQLIAFIHWAGGMAIRREFDVASRDRLLDAVVATVSGDDEKQGGVVALGAILNYVSANKIPAGLPVPPTTIPFELTGKCVADHLQALGWQALDIVPWLRFLLETQAREEHDMTRTAKFAAQILTVLSKNWDQMSNPSKATVISLLQSRTVMPTKLGMRKPTESFSPSVKMFNDLPTIEGCSHLKDRFLTAIGVRKTLDLDTIFKRLLNSAPEGTGSGHAPWSHVELIKYLVSVQRDIPKDDMRALEKFQMCPAEVRSGGPTAGATQPSTQLYKVSELFEPRDDVRPLGVRMLYWPGGNGGYRSRSAEGSFLSGLGLRPYPSAAELVDLMCCADATLRQAAMNYFVTNHVSNGYQAFDMASSPKSFLPVEGGDGQLVPPSRCFTNVNSAILGFNTLSYGLHAHAQKFCVRADPPITECVARLVQNPPRDYEAALDLFGYFASRQTELQKSHFERLREAPIVPIVRNGQRTSRSSRPSGESITYLSPAKCYLGSSRTYRNIFDFVDFGKTANSFLQACGSKWEPTALEIGQLLSTAPARVLGEVQTTAAYLELLRSLAKEKATLQRDQDLWRKMKAAAFLLAFQEISGPKDKSTDFDEDEYDAPIKDSHLTSASQIVIQNDYIAYRQFKDGLLCAPEEEMLEDFYEALGSQRLGSLVTEDLTVGPLSAKQDGAVWLRKHVLERAKIFLHEYKNSGRDTFQHDHKWLEQKLVIRLVRSLSLRRTLRQLGPAHTEERSAACDKTSEGLVLHISSKSSQPEMYQVSQAICSCIMSNPSPQAYQFFESLLTLDLLHLKSRGYNVDRILRAKAAEARIAEESRQKALEAEQASIREAEQQFEKQQRQQAVTARGQTLTPPPIMPGSFGSPERPNQAALPPNPGLFSTLSRHLGLGTGRDEQHKSIDTDRGEQQTKRLGSSEGDASTALPPSGPITEHRPKQKKEGETGKVTSPAVIQQNLLNAIQASRSYDSSALFSTATTTTVQEQTMYCDSAPAHDLVFVAEASNGLHFFVSKNLTMEPSAFMSANHVHINTFAYLLAEVSDVYAIKPSSMHMYYDETGSSIAFNLNGSIFCNLRFYIQLHSAKFKESGCHKAEAAVYWWVVIAHELAHNITKLHNADHSFYTESFIQRYFPKMLARTNAMVRPVDNMATAPPPTGQQASGGYRLSAPPPPYRF